jgi:hypothetical protein
MSEAVPPATCAEVAPDVEMVSIPKSIADRMFSTRQAKARREIYFVQAVTLGLIKIGVADEACARLRQLAMGSPDRLKVLGTHVCEHGGKTEPALHEKFAEFRAHGEWFRPDERLLEWIDTHCTKNLHRILFIQSAIDEPAKARGRKPKSTEPIDGLARHREKEKRLRDLRWEIERRQMIRLYRREGKEIPAHYLNAEA